MKNSRIVFMGTPDFACGILQRLIDEQYNVVAVVSQPDKKTGRKQVLTPTPVKQLALKRGIEVVQPISIKTEYESVLAYHPDLIITCAYGQIVPVALLSAVHCINVHASLLPRNRGGAPIHKAIIYGEKVTGVSIMEMAKQMDAGAVCAVKKVEIEEDDTMGDLHDKLMKCGADCLIEVLPSILDHTAVFVAQDEDAATFSYNVSKEEEKIDFSKTLQEVYDHIRGLIPYPVGYAYLDGKKMKFHKARKQECDHCEPAGKILGFDDAAMLVAVEGGILRVLELQMEGKSRCSAVDFKNGAGRNAVGKYLK